MCVFRGGQYEAADCALVSRVLENLEGKRKSQKVVVEGRREKVKERKILAKDSKSW